MTGNHQPEWKFSFHMNSTYYVVVQKTGTFLLSDADTCLIK